MKKIIKIVLIILTIVLLIALGLYIYVRLESKKEFSLYDENRFIIYPKGISTVVAGGLGNTTHYYEVDLSKKKMDYRGDSVVFDIEANEGKDKRGKKRELLAIYFLSNEEVDRLRACILNIKSKTKELEENSEYELIDNTQNENATTIEKLKDEVKSKPFYYLIKFENENLEVFDKENIKELRKLINEIIL